MKTKQEKYIGYFFLALAVAFLNPILDFTDILTLKLYSIYSGVDVSITNLSAIYLDYFIWCVVVGAICLIIAINFLGWGLKRTWKKINPGKYSIALMIAFGTLLLVALLDIWSANSGIFGNLIQYTSGQFGADWWPLFFKFALVIFAIPAICYYFLVHKDLSESIGIFLFSLILYFGGVADVFYFVLRKVSIPAELPWLIGSPFISFISRNLGYATITNVSLLVSVFVSVLCALFLAKILKEKF